MKTKLSVGGGNICNVFLDNETFEFSPGRKPNPIHFLEVAVLGCIGIGISSYLKEKEIDCPFSDVSVAISNDTIKIFCRCNDIFQNDFNSLVSGCFVTEKLAFRKEVKFK